MAPALPSEPAAHLRLIELDLVAFPCKHGAHIAETAEAHELLAPGTLPLHNLERRRAGSTNAIQWYNGTVVHHAAKSSIPAAHQGHTRAYQGPPGTLQGHTTGMPGASRGVPGAHQGHTKGPGGIPGTETSGESEVVRRSGFSTNARPSGSICSSSCNGSRGGGTKLDSS